MASVLGLGATLYYGTAGAGASTQIARVRSITPPAPETPDVDRSHLLSTAREYLAGLPDFGELEFTVEYDETQSVTLYGMLGDRHSWKITLADGSDFTWDGYIKAIGTEGVAIDEIVVNTITVKVDGAMSVAAGT